MSDTKCPTCKGSGYQPTTNPAPVSSSPVAESPVPPIRKSLFRDECQFMDNAKPCGNTQRDHGLLNHEHPFVSPLDVTLSDIARYPRSGCALSAVSHVKSSVAALLDLAERQESEIQKLRKANAEGAAELAHVSSERDSMRMELPTIAALKAENARLQADKARVDWLSRQANCVVTINGLDHYLGDADQPLREAVDALAGSPKETAP